MFSVVACLEKGVLSVCVVFVCVFVCFPGLLVLLLFVLICVVLLLVVFYLCVFFFSPAVVHFVLFIVLLFFCCWSCVCFVFGDVVVLFGSCVVVDACLYRLLCRF